MNGNAFDDRMSPEVAAIANQLLTAMQQAGPKDYRPGREQSRNVIDRRPGGRSILEILGDRATTTMPWADQPHARRVPGLDAIYPKGID